MPVKNQAFYDALKDYCKSAFGIIANHFSSPGGLPLIVRPTFKMDSANSYSEATTLEIDWFELHNIIEGKLQGKNALVHLLQTVESDPQIAKHFNTLVGTSESSQAFNSSMFLRATVLQIYHQQQSPNLNESVFHKIYEQVENFFYGLTFTFRCFAPIENFQMEVERIDFDPRFSISRFPEKDKEQILASSAQFGYHQRDIIFNENVFEAIVEVPKVVGSFNKAHSGPGPYGLARGKFEDCCEALRLFKRGAIGFNDIWSENVSWSFSTGSSRSSALVRFRGPTYTLTSNEVGSFKDFWHAYQRAKKVGQSRIDLALRRFNFGYERVRPEDKLIDYMIGLEALLLEADERQELNYRLSLRGAVLLGTTPEERRKTHQELDTAYKERSRIVHGGTAKTTVKVGGAAIEFAEFVGVIEDRLRSTIKGFLLRGDTQTEAQVINDLERKIITGA